MNNMELQTAREYAKQNEILRAKVKQYEQDLADLKTGYFNQLDECMRLRFTLRNIMEKDIDIPNRVSDPSITETELVRELHFTQFLLDESHKTIKQLQERIDILEKKLAEYGD